MASAQTKIAAGKVHQWPIAKIVPDPNQPRKTFTESNLADLAANVKVSGVQQPITVSAATGGNVTIIDGERRWRAAKLAKLKTVPVLVGAKTDSVQKGIDQVALNNLHESLAPMDLARWLVRMRDVEKMTPNDMAARLEKSGFKQMSRSHVANLMRMVELKPWAQKWLDDGSIDVTAARSVLNAQSNDAVLKVVEQELKRQMDWKGRLLTGDVDDAIHAGYKRAGIDLTYVHGWTPEEKAALAHFDYKKVCTNCEHLRKSGSSAFCLNPKEFAKHNAEAKEAGLGLLGKKAQKEKAATDKPLTKAQERKAEVKKAKQRVESLRDKTESYLHRWLTSKVQLFIVSDADGSARMLNSILLFAVAARPGVSNHTFAGWRDDSYRSNLVGIARKHGIKTIADAQVFGPTVTQELACEILNQLPYAEIQDLSHIAFGTELASIWKVDGAFLDLLQKDELAAIANLHCPHPEGKTYAALKVADIKAAILERAADLPPSPLMEGVYTNKSWRDFSDLSDDADEADVPTCRMCGCTEDDACSGGCSWVDGKKDLCTACAEELPSDEGNDESEAAGE